MHDWRGLVLAPWFERQGIEPIYAMCAGVVAGGVLQLAVQIPVLRRLHLLPRVGWRWSAIRAAWADGGVRRILQLMAPALLGVGVAQLSLMINTQIASYLAPGSVTWLFYADRLMEFPTALLGVALGVVLTPQLAAAKAAEDGQRYSHMLDWGLRLVLLLALPCAVGLLALPSRWWPPCSTGGLCTAVMCSELPWPWWATGWGCWGWWRSRCWHRVTLPAKTCARR